MKGKSTVRILTLFVLLPILIVTAVAAGIFYRAGDVDGSGAVDQQDITGLMEHLAGAETDVIEENLDTNGDGVVNGKDLTHLDRYLSGGNVELSGGVTVEDPVVCSSFVYGSSELGRDLVCYQISQKTYRRTVLLNFAIHGFEDEYYRDGKVLVELGNMLVKYYSAQPSMNGCRLLIVPCANPDGVYEGTTNYGFGRCNAKGIDLNRDFDANYIPYYNSRNYTPYAFSAKESRALRDLCKKYQPDVVIDFHGWLNYTIGDGAVAAIFSQEMGLSHYVSFNSTNCSGYFANWAHQNGSLGLLVEFKSSTSVDKTKLINAVNRLVTGAYKGGNSSTQLHSLYGSFKNIKGYTLSTGRVNTFSGIGIPFSGASYIDGSADSCTIQEIYEDGWVKVSYPVSSGTKTAYCPLSAFFDTTHSTKLYTGQVSSATTVYARADRAKSIGQVATKDIVYVIADDGKNLQIIYPLDAGGWKVGWILRSDLK